MAKNGEKLTKKGPEIVADADVFSSPGFILRLNGLKFGIEVALSMVQIIYFLHPWPKMTKNGQKW